MLIATRTLTLRSERGKQPIQIRLFAPVEDNRTWKCQYEIDWPDRPRKFYGAGIDGPQALYAALQMIGLDIYRSQYHASGNLYLDAPGRGYGFPVPKDLRSQLIGDDLLYDG